MKKISVRLSEAGSEKIREMGTDGLNQAIKKTKVLPRVEKKREQGATPARMTVKLTSENWNRLRYGNLSALVEVIAIATPVAEAKPMKRGRPRRSKLDVHEIDIMEMVESGTRVVDISREIGIDYRNLRHWLRKRGLLKKKGE